MESRGLSPRARGNHGRSESEETIKRSIPACAGEPKDHDSRQCCFKVYPRVRGGTPLRSRFTSWPAGLSPRARGNHLDATEAVPLAGSIPACAGEPPAQFIEFDGGQVYPRVRGGTGTSHRP